MDVFLTVVLREGCMNTQSLSSAALPEEENFGMIEPVRKRVNRSWKKSAGMFSGQKSLGGILVVDDDPEVRKRIRLTLGKVGYDILEAEDGQAAINVLSSGKSSVMIDTIITDLNIPKVDGFAVIAYCKMEYPKIPLIVLTRIADVQLATSLMGEGVSDYLVKPVDAKKLIASVENTLAQRQLSWA
jgi:DNA-binding NtrC family response regulator